MPTGLNTTNGVADYRIDTPKPISTSATAGSIYSNVGEDPALVAARNDQANYAKTSANQTIDEAAIRAQTLASFQAEIDSQNAVYADKLNVAKNTGANRLGSGTAIQARRGMLGSDFGTAITDNINTSNNDIYSSINNEKAAKVQEIMGYARKAATDEIATKRKAKQEGLDSYVKYLTDAGTRKTDNANKAATLLLQQGHKVSDLNPTDLQVLTQNYGITEDDLKNAYGPMEKTKIANEKTIADAEAKRLADIGYTTATTTKAIAEADAQKSAVKLAEAKSPSDIAYQNAQTEKTKADKLKTDADTKKVLNELNGVVTSKDKTEYNTKADALYQKSQPAQEFGNIQQAKNRIDTATEGKRDDKTYAEIAGDGAKVRAIVDGYMAIVHPGVSRLVDPNGVESGTSLVEYGTQLVKKIITDGGDAGRQSLKEIIEASDAQYLTAKKNITAFKDQFSSQIETQSGGQFGRPLLTDSYFVSNDNVAPVPKAGTVVDSSDTKGLQEGQTGNNGTMIVRNGKWVENK